MVALTGELSFSEPNLRAIKRMSPPAIPKAGGEI